MRSLKCAGLWLVIFTGIVVTRAAGFWTSLDRVGYALALDLSYSDRWVSFWESVSRLASGWTLYPVVVIALLWGLKHLPPAAFVRSAFLATAAFTVNTAFKYLFRSDRPVSLSPYSDLATYSFPSGHAFNSVVLFFFLPEFLQIALPRLGIKALPWPLAVCGAALIGLSRVLLGAHWVSDVSGGWALGAAVCGLLLGALRKEFKR